MTDIRQFDGPAGETSTPQVAKDQATEVASTAVDQGRQTASVAADAVGERAWPLPMFPLYGEMIKGSVADIRNTGGSRYGGAITAAKFLEAFVGGTPWAHLDIAGPAWAERDSATREAGGTGCFVRTLVELARCYPA